MSNLLLTGITVTLLISLGASAQTLDKNTQKTSMLYLQQADTGRIETLKDKKNCYQLTLGKLTEKVLYVSEEPQRITGTLSTQEFLDSWQHHEKTKKSYPNAILHAKDSQQGTWISDAVVLSALVYDNVTQTLHYSACPLSVKDPIKNRKLVDVTLFIDPFDPWPP